MTKLLLVPSPPSELNRKDFSFQSYFHPSFSKPILTSFHSLLGISFLMTILDCDFLSRFWEKQFGFRRLLVYLSDKKEKTVTEILKETEISVHQLYTSIGKARELGLVKTRVENNTYPPRNLVAITSTGVSVSDKLKEKLKILFLDPCLSVPCTYNQF